MNCEEFRDAVLESIYGTPPANDLEPLRRHAAECPQCAKVFARTSALWRAYDLRDRAPLPDPEISWRVIRERSFGRPRRFQFPVLSRRFALATAVVAAAFVVGAIIGRLFLFAPGGRVPAGPAGQYQDIASVPVYLQTVEPLLVDFVNNSDRRAPEETAQVTAHVVAEMLSRTRFLKAAAVRSGDWKLYDLLDDVEMALISIANLGGQNGEIASQIERFIRDEALIPKVRALASSGTI